MVTDITPIIVAVITAAVMLFVALGSLVLVLFTWLRSDIREVRQDVKGILGRQFSPKDFLAAQAAYERVMAVQEALVQEADVRAAVAQEAQARATGESPQAA